MLINFPIKGVNRLLARSAQPPNTAWDMLNMLPTDRSERMRGGKRTGTSKLWASPIGVSADQVVLLDQATLTSAAVAGATVFNDPFTYANGELGASSGAVWSVYSSYLGTASTVMTIASNKATLPPGLSSGTSDATFMKKTTTPTYDVEGGYSLEVKVTLKATNLDTVGFLFALECDDTTFFTTGPVFNVSITRNTDATSTIEITPLGSTFTDGVDYYFEGASTAVTDNVEFTLKVVVTAGTGTSRTATTTIDGVQVGAVLPLPAATGVDDFVLGFRNTSDLATGVCKIDDVTLATTGSEITGNPVRSTHLIGVANRDIFMGDIDTQATVITGGTNALAASVVPQGCYSQGKYYLVDGSTIVVVDLATRVASTLVATAGSLPTGVTLCCIWRDRLVLADGFNFYMSRVGTHTDFEYGLPNDPACAFAGNDAIAGHIGEPLIALMPLSDDTLALGGDHDLHIIRGDPAAGGSIDLVSDQIGILGPRAWCKDPEGNVYFAGTGGFFRYTSKRGAELLSGTSYSQFFTAVDRSASQVILAWHRDRQGCFVFVTKYGTNKNSVHLWYDRRTDSEEQRGGLFPLQYPISHGPQSALVYDGDEPTDRVLLMGGRDGYVRKMDTSYTDDGTAITAYVTILIPIGTPTNDAVLSRVIVTLGDDVAAANMGVTVKLMTGLTAYDVTQGTAKHLWTRRYNGRIGRLEAIRAKLRGVFAAFVLYDDSTDRTFSFENASVEVEAGGTTRR